MSESFGARLRRRREQQEIALITIAQQTKIKTSLLDALERDDVSQWPSGIFRRAFVRSYARAIGLDADVVVREFLEAHPDPDEIAATASAIASGADGAPMGAGPPTRLREIVGSAIGALSRLRRGSAEADLVVAGGVPVNVPPPAQVDLPAATHLSLEAGPVEAPAGAAANGTGVGALPCLEPETPAAAHPSGEMAPYDPDLMAVAHLSTEFGRVENTDQVQPLLQEAARILEATGLIVWVWDAQAVQLRPVLAHGYSDSVLVRLPAVRREADNPTAAAFRSARGCAISGSDDTSGALVVPLLTPAGCAGVLALELPRGREQATSVRAVATIVAAMLAQLIGGGGPAEIRPQTETIAPSVGDFTTPIPGAHVRG
jgi:transcriptional regulator with XRE-family HTH domain